MPSAKRLGACIGSRDNNFNLIRFVAASAVLVGHSWPLALGPRTQDPLGAATGYSLGSLAVDVFFITSGFLVTGSLDKRRNIVDFTIGRILRIYPALIVSVVVVALCLGAMFANEPLGAWLMSKPVLGHIWMNTSFTTGAYPGLPGVFENTPYPVVVNGSLWTLPREIRMYTFLGLAWIVVVALNRYVIRKPPAKMFAAIIVAAAVGGTLLHLGLAATGRRWSTVALFAMFFQGAVFYILRDRIVLTTPLIVGSTALFAAASLHPAAFFLAHNLVLAYIVFWLAFAPAGAVRLYNRLGDYSYGVYILAFPVQQTVAAMTPDVGVFGMIVRAMPITLALAVLSWHCVEKPALGLKERFFARERRAPALAAAKPSR